MAEIENPLSKPVVLFSMNAAALTTILGLGELTEFEKYFNVPLALGCFLVGVIASLLHLYYRQLADDDFAELAGFREPWVPDSPPKPVRFAGAAILLGVTAAGMITLVGAMALKVNDRVHEYEKQQAAAVAEAIKAEAKVVNALPSQERAAESKKEEVTALRREAAAKRAAADAAMARAQAAAKAAERSIPNLIVAGVLLALIAGPLLIVLLLGSPSPDGVEKTIRALAGAAGLVSLMIFVLGLSVGSVPGITAGLSTGAAAVGDKAEAPPGPAQAVVLVQARDGSPGTPGMPGAAGAPGAPASAAPIVIYVSTTPSQGSGEDGDSTSPGTPPAVVREIVYQGPPGPPGQKGERGPPGVNGGAGLNGGNGQNGLNGEDGKDPRCWLIFCRGPAKDTQTAATPPPRTAPAPAP